MKMKLSCGLAILLVGMLVSEVVAIAPAYNLTPLDQPPNQKYVRMNYPMDMNENGMVVGAPGSFWFGPSSVTRPVRWENPTAEAVVLGGLSYGSPGSLLPNSYAEGVNNASVTVGRSKRFENYETVGIRAVYWLPGSTTAVELPPAPNRVDSQGNWSSGASSITDGGLIGGQSSYRPVIWDSLMSTPTELSVRSGRVNALNDSRQAGGYINVKLGSSSGLQPVRWETDGSRTDLETLGSSSSGTLFGMALAINSVGDTTGYSIAYDDAGQRIGERPVFWAAGESDVTILSLPATGFDAVGDVRAWDINDSNTIVGTFSNLPTGAARYELYGVIWDGPEGEMVILDNLLNDAAGWRIISALAINEFGCITAIAEGPDECNTVVVLTPAVPEPDGLAMLLVGTIAFLCRNWRRR